MSTSSFDEEDAKATSDILSFSIKHFDIGPEMKRAVERILLCVDTRDMNTTLLVAAAAVLSKSGERVDMRFSTFCDEVINDIIDTDPNISGSKFYDRTIVKKNILRYCRLILSR